MGDDREKVFDSIESAQEYMTLLLSSIEEAIRDVSGDREQAVREANERRIEALDLTLYKLKCLDATVHKNQRLLNDLRSLRRLLFHERAHAAV